MFGFGGYFCMFFSNDLLTTVKKLNQFSIRKSYDNGVDTNSNNLLMEND